LPIAEILFKNYPDGKEKVVGYTSKWNEKSFEYKNTVRSFTVDPDDTDLLMKLKKITEECWKVFNLSGYARVDYRVSEDGEIYILEVNANPCISPDAGFSAACNKAGYSYTKMIENIIKASTK
jgi:D-alanine-D-alanine ligase